ncbi:hypothetical protein [Gloeobacter kilaueensis]|uniref:Uncharacterized protein n=1 Tax=Gloeobacter kilaueensis (strain ATCC BAA-2537 / CCAP 1431/1 / ULC 316 / JS1) TaxID=1183438 RepID=U5QDB8_GLOK1|nr:hypothetical protein [Gloeobacter kilaueensis]AGY56823.1 hypothetical protein GKIL_0577 [Gloeobacter kilaueensis JS1]
MQDPSTVLAEGTGVPAGKPNAAEFALTVQNHTATKERLEVSFEIVNRSKEKVVLINAVSSDATKTPDDLNPGRIAVLPGDRIRVGQFGLGLLSPTFPPLYSFTLLSPGKSYSTRVSINLPPQAVGKPAELCVGLVAASVVAPIKDLQLQEGKPVVHRTGSTFGSEEVFVCKAL